MKTEHLKKAIVPLLILCGGLFLRLFRLGTASLQIDNIIFWDLFSREVSAAGIISQWMELTGLTGQLPFVAAAAKLFIDFFHLPLSFRTMILPFSLCGALTVPVAYMAGREFGGKRMAVLLAAMAAFSPICIQMSREAYFYTPALLGSFLALWAAGLSGRLLKQEPLPRRFHFVNAAAFLVMTWSSPSAWPYAFFFALFNTALLGRQFILHRRGAADLLILLATYLVIGLPLLLAPWGIAQIKQFTSDGATRDYWTQVFASGRGVSQWTKIVPVFSAYAWGITPVRQIFSGLVFFSGLVCYLAGFRKNRTFTFMGFIFITVLVLNIMAVEKSVWIFGITRVVPLVPFYLLFLSAGVLHPFEKLRGKRGAAVALLIPAVGFGLWVEPVLLIPQMTGLPRPFSEVASWADQNLPPDTPIVTERFFTAYNEFRVHAPKKVQFISTVPNQIPEQYIGFQFRERTLQFFKDNPGSAFYEEKHLWENPETGPWTEVRDLFARSHKVVNHAGMRLEQLGLFYRGEPGIPFSEDPFCSTLYYNLPEDAAERARADGHTSLILLSDGWKTVQTSDYRLWRMLQNEASVEVWNFTDDIQKASLVFQGAAVGGTKQVSLNGLERKLFQNGQITAWVTKPVELVPGKSRLTLCDVSPHGGVPLLISSAGIHSAEP